MFKPGDKVRVKQVGTGCGHVKRQQIVTVRCVTDNALHFVTSEDEPCYEPIDLFELVEAKEESMAYFEVGDRVKIIGLDVDDDENTSTPTGHIGEVTCVGGTDYEVDDQYYYPASSLEKVNSQGDNNMSKFFKVIKETPELEVGAILTHYSGDSYRPLNELWNKDGIEGTVMVTPENKPAYYEQVYASNFEGRTVYVDKATARELLNKEVNIAEKAAK